MRAEMYELHHELENTHWWFTARREIVLSVLRDQFARVPELRAGARLLDVGCGAGGMLEWLSEFGTPVGLDPAPAAVEFAAASGHTVRLGGLPSDLPFAGEVFDVITLLDVLEHVEEDEQSLVTLRGLLPDHGRLIITVPAFAFLWSRHDVVNEHKRRYTLPLLRQRLTDAGFTIDMLSYYNTALFLPIAAIRLAKRIASDDESTGDLGAVPAAVNAVLHHVFSAERHVLRRLRLPFGVSLLAVAHPHEAHSGAGS